jgi:hypothetical protein
MVVVGCAAAILGLAAVLVPRALGVDRSEVEPVDRTGRTPPTITEAWTFDPKTTPIDGDGGWGTRAVPRAARLAALDGTGLERYAAAAFEKAYPRWPAYHQPGQECDCAPVSMRLEYGTVLLRASYIGSGIGRVLTLEGTYQVEGRMAIFDFAGVGSSTYRWQLTEDRQQLTFTFVSAEQGSTISGLPAEVTLRMLLTATPFLGTHRGF